MTVRRLLPLALGAVLVLGACADDPAPAGDGVTPTPIDASPADGPAIPADGVVLRIANEGGFVPAGFPLLDVPVFTLYGDGTIITPGAQIAIYPSPALPAIVERQVDPAAVRAIVDRALDAGLGDGELDLSDTGDVAIADASTTVFTLTVDGATSTAKVYAMGFEGDPATMPGVSDAELEVRRDLAALAADLTDLSWVEREGGSLGEEALFVGEAARLVIGPVLEDPELPQEPVTWPLDDPLRRIGEPVSWDPRTRCAVLEGDDWSTVRAAAEGANQLSPWSDGRVERSIAFRPLLPGEAGC
jgi:hypothetical protein